MSTNNTISVGTGIFYTGDMANVEGFGVVTSVPENGWLNIEMNDGRVFKMVSVLSFAAGPGRRFWTAKERAEYRAQQLADLKRRYGQVVR